MSCGDPPDQKILLLRLTSARSATSFGEKGQRSMVSDFRKEKFGQDRAFHASDL
jgi:hypothetical protein